MKLPIEPSAIIFDLDGTLLDTEILYSEATQKVLDQWGHQYTLALKRRVMGGDSTRSAQLTIDEFDLPLTPAEYLAQRETHLAALFPMAQEISGAGAYLKHLASLGINTGLATSSHAHLCQMKIGHRDWRTVFSQVVCGDDKELARGKPNPDIFLLCADRMQADPATTIAFEDSVNGIDAARAAGMIVVGIESPYNDAKDLKNAHLTISSYESLL